MSIPFDTFEHIYSTVTATKCQNKACLLQPAPNEVSTEWQPDSCDREPLHFHDLHMPEALTVADKLAAGRDSGWFRCSVQVPTEATLQLVSPSYINLYRCLVPLDNKTESNIFSTFAPPLFALSAVTLNVCVAPAIHPTSSEP